MDGVALGRQEARWVIGTPECAARSPTLTVNVLLAPTEPSRPASRARDRSRFGRCGRAELPKLGERGMECYEPLSDHPPQFSTVSGYDRHFGSEL